MLDTQETGLSGQSLLLEAWRARLNGREFIRRDDLPFSQIACEVAHVSVLAVEGDALRFRLSGGGVRQAFGCDSRGLTVEEISCCRGAVAWGDGVKVSLLRMRPTAGRTRMADGSVHYWMRLPMSSDGVNADLVLCHDRYLPADALADPDRAARAADVALRLDAVEVCAA